MEGTKQEMHTSGASALPLADVMKTNPSLLNKAHCHIKKTHPCHP